MFIPFIPVPFLISSSLKDTVTYTASFAGIAGVAGFSSVASAAGMAGVPGDST